SFVAQSRTPRNRCVRFATTVASGHATLATKRTLLLTWAGLTPAGSHQLCLAHSFDHLVGLSEKRRRDFEIQSLCCLLIYNELEFCWSLDGEVSWVFSAKHLVHVMRCASVLVHKFNAVGHNSTILREVTVGVQSNETMNRNERDDLGTMNDRKHIR